MAGDRIRQLNISFINQLYIYNLLCPIVCHVILRKTYLFIFIQRFRDSIYRFAFLYKTLQCLHTYFWCKYKQLYHYWTYSFFFVCFVKFYNQKIRLDIIKYYYYIKEISSPPQGLEKIFQPVGSVLRGFNSNGTRLN